VKAFILAGGKSTRLRPLTWELPKPLAPVMNVPVMDTILHLLRRHGIRDVCATLMFMPQKIKDRYGDGSHFGVRMTYSTEARPLGTAGCVKAAEDIPDSTFAVISGDCITDFDLGAAIRFHKEHQAEATLLMTRVDVPIDYGVLITDPDGNITGFQEKPGWGGVFTNQVNTGIYILEPSVLDLIPRDEPYDFARDLFPELLRQKRKICGYAAAGYWNDIGSFTSYARTHFEILDGRMVIELPGFEPSPGIHVGPNTVIDPSAILRPPCLIGANCRIGPGVVLDRMCVIGDNTVLEEDVSISRSILWNNCRLDFASEIRGCILANRVHLMHNTLVSENTVIGEGTLVREYAVLKANVLIWPRKIIDPYADVDSSVIFPEHHANMIFGRNGISGIINVDITPEYATRLGAAYGTRLGRKSTVAVSWDGTPPARLFRYAFIAGLLSIGVKVYDLQSLFLPVARQTIPLLGVSGGIHIMRDNDSIERLQVVFICPTGANVDKDFEKSVEDVYAKEEFLHTNAGGIGKVEEMPDAPDSYARHLVNLCDVDLFRRTAPRIILASADERLTDFLGKLFTSIGCDVVESLVMDRFSPHMILQESDLQDVVLCAWLDRNAETVTLLDRSGRMVSEDLLHLLTAMILYKSVPGISLLIPVSCPSAADKLAVRYGGTLKRVRTDESALLRSLMEDDVFAEAYNQYQLQHDAIASLLFILEFLIRNAMSLEDAVRRIPPWHTETRSIHCPWEMMGRVMHRLITEPHAGTIDTTDGVRYLLDGGWVLVLPDVEQPMLRIIAEGNDARTTRDLIEHQVARIEWMIDSP
jgi:mannose-1-phosphate guanylyltransferase / phosphomannomutase